MDDKRNYQTIIPQWLKPQSSSDPSEKRRSVSLKSYIILALTAILLITHTTRSGMFSSWLGARCERTWHFDFDHLKVFEMVEQLEPATGFRRGLDGLVRVEKACPEQTVDLTVDVVLSRPSGSELDGIDIKPSREGGLAGLLIENAYPRPDLSSSTLNIILHVKSGLELVAFQNYVRHLSIELCSGLRIDVNDTASLTALSGSIRSNLEENSFPAPTWNLQTGSGGIHGGWSQGNRLAVASNSGNIDLTVFPKERSSDKDPMATTLDVRSTSGSARVHYPLSGDIPERVFNSMVRTESGRISGSFILGDYLRMKSSSGGIQATVLPRLATQKAQIITDSTSGTTDVEILPAHVDPEAALRELSGSHTTTSGGLRIQYPQSWEGGIHGKTMSGGLTLRGRDVHIESSGGGPVGRRVTARKGDGNGAIDFSSMSGSARVQVGSP